MSKGEKKKQELIEDYKKALSKYTLENKELEQKINDVKMTLNLNQNLLFDYILKSNGENEEAKNLVNNTKKAWEEAQSYIDNNNLIEIKIARLQELIEDTPTKIREDINEISAKNNKVQEEINEKDKTIKKLKIDLDKTRKNALFKVARTEVYVTDPTKFNLEAMQEVIGLKSILSSVIPIHARKKDDAEKIKREVEGLRKKLDELIEKAYKIYDKIDNKKSTIKNKKIEKQDLNKFLKTIEGYDLNVDISDDENDEDEDDDNNAENKEYSDSDDEEVEENNKKKIKAKEKELEKLTEEYKKLKNECAEYEKKISEHKKIYKDIKTKMKNLKESVNFN